MPSLEELPVGEQARILRLRLDRAERALVEAETALEARMHELDRANKDLSRRESELVERLDVESRQLLAALSTANMATIYGEKNRPFSASGEAAALLGIADGKEATVELLVDALHPLDRDRIMRSAVSFFTELPVGVDHRFDHRIKRLDTGETRWLSWVIRREPKREGKPSATYGTVRDITLERTNARGVRALQLRAERRVAELNRLSGQLTSEQKKTSAALAVKTKFLTEMAHKIRTPLGSLTGGIELLSGTLNENKDFDVIKQATEQLVTIATSLIDEADEPSLLQDFRPAANSTQSIDEKGALPVSGASPRVLLAEDTESNRYVIERMLTELGCEAVVAANGVEALDAVRRDTFDLILMDVMMPLMDGEEATRAIRSMSGPASRTPIVGVTAHSLHAERERLLAAGMTACLTKPLKREALEYAIRTSVLARDTNRPLNAKFDHEVFQRAFFDLPTAYRDRMRQAVKQDISDYGQAVLDAVTQADEEALSKAAHSLKGVSLNVGAIGIIEQLTVLREAKGDAAAEMADNLRTEIAASLLSFDDFYQALVGEDQ